ncbi:MAG: YkgJ family cysteine cluster protein [candidate division Zixibacteria bacterium]|nr:YkgJ family cysteine cluster protein [candidate division Zixibacteria bacterium]
MKELENLKQTILKEYPRLCVGDKFKFACHPDVSCFNDCCNDVNIFLTPYDIIRMKNNLGISSNEFLAKYTITPIEKNQRHPVVMMKMTEDEKTQCHFVTDKGCSIYNDRPWPCRMYPLGSASPSEGNIEDKEFFFLMKEDICKGFEENSEWTVEEWMDNQGAGLYNEMGEYFKQISLHPWFDTGQQLSPEKMDMFHLVCYNIDKFRRFMLESTFLDKFDVDEDIVEKIKTDDIVLFKFGIEWLKFSLFGEKTMKVKGEVAESVKKKSENNNKH